MTIKEIRNIMFPFLGVQSIKWQGKGEEIAAAWSDGYKTAIGEVWDHLDRLEKEE